MGTAQCGSLLRGARRAAQGFRRLQRQLGAAFVFVTPDQGETTATSDSIAVMSAEKSPRTQ
jgi:ABC-type Fe3+/spermidine/putrescine transport system ATPase subunit